MLIGTKQEIQGKKGCGERAITRSKLGRPFLARREAPRSPLSAMWDGELHRDTLPISQEKPKT